MVEWEPIRVPRDLLEQIRKLLRKYPMWINEHEFIRDAIREKIESADEAKEVSPIVKQCPRP